MKKCPKCQKELPNENFSNNKSKKDKLSTYCKSCTVYYRKNSYLKKREHYLNKTKEYKKEIVKNIQDLKSDLSCSKCGENHPAVLDFHHRDPQEKEFSISYAVRSLSKEKLQKEIEKCDVLCSNCHRKLHYNTLR